MWDEIARLAADEGLTILLTTHYLEEADRLASRSPSSTAAGSSPRARPDELKGELRGDAVHVELAEPGRPGRAGRRPAPGSRRCARSACRRPPLSARADDGAAAVPPCSPRWSGPGSPCTVTVARPSLDDVYLRYAGRRFAEAEQPGPAAASPPRPRGRRTDDRHRRPHHLVMTQRQLKAPAGSPSSWSSACPAGDLAVPVRLPLQEGRRAARLRRPLVPGLPGPRRGRDERAVLQHVGGHGHAGGDRARHPQPLPVTPVSRGAVINANVVMQAITTALQSVIIVLLGLAGGAHYPGGAAGWSCCWSRRSCSATVFGALSNAVGHAGPAAGDHHRHQHVPAAAADVPVLGVHGPGPDAVLDADRRRLQPGQLGAGSRRGRRCAPTRTGARVLARGGGLLALAVAVTALSVLTFRSYQKSV